MGYQLPNNIRAKETGIYRRVNKVVQLEAAAGGEKVYDEWNDAEYIDQLRFDLDDMKNNGEIEQSTSFSHYLRACRAQLEVQLKRAKYELEKEKLITPQEYDKIKTLAEWSISAIDKATDGGKLIIL